MKKILVIIIVFLFTKLDAQSIEVLKDSLLFGDEKIAMFSNKDGHRLDISINDLFTRNFLEINGSNTWKILGVDFKNITSNGYLPPLGQYLSEVKNQNLPTSTKSNFTTKSGFNTNGQGGRIDNNEHSIATAMEYRYFIPGGLLNENYPYEVAEWHIELNDKNGNHHRPITIAAGVDGKAGVIGFDVDDVHYNGYSTGQALDWYKISRVYKYQRFDDTITVINNKRQDNIPLSRFHDGSRLWDIHTTVGDKLILNKEANPLSIDAIKLNVPNIPIVTGATSSDANANAISAGVSAGEAYKWDDGSAIFMMIRK